MTSARAMVLQAPRDIQERRFEMAEPEPGGGWIQVEATGICGSDVPYWAAPGPLKYPMVMGHEIVGRIAAVDERRPGGSSPGDRVMVEEAIPCWQCPVCLSGRQRICPRQIRYGGAPVSTWPFLWGGYADYVYLHPRAILHRVPEGLSPAAATLAIPVSNGLDWLGRAAGLRPGESVVVHGPGQHGLACVAAAARLGAGRIVMTGTRHDGRRLEAARALGADAAVVADADAGNLDEMITGALGGRAPDVIVDVTPRAAEPILSAVRLLAPAGRLVLAGAKRGELVSGFDPDLVFRKELSILGVAARSSQSMAAALAWLAEKPETFEPLDGTVLALGELELGLAMAGGELAGDRPVHVVVTP